jgi:hypothetical protein
MARGDKGFHKLSKEEHLARSRKGGLATAARRRGHVLPFRGTILDVMAAAGLVGTTWRAWHAFLAALFRLKLDAEQLATFQRHTERDDPPVLHLIREAWMSVGRRGGKSIIAAVVGLFKAVTFDASQLARGETAVVMLLAADRRQARTVLNYLKGLCSLPEFKDFVFRVLADRIEFRTGVNVEVHTASYRTTRGYTLVGIICDEIAFWRTDDGSANPDSEVLAALRPGMATVPGALLLCLSSPYAAKGELFKAHERYFGRPEPRVLCWNADTRSMNPTVPDDEIERTFEDDPISAASEYGRDGRVQFRRDVEAFLDGDAIRAVTMQDRRELPPQSGTRYLAFVDPSGGSQDSFTLAIAHADSETAILDAVREVRPPFSPDGVVQQFADLLKSYSITKVVGDRYAGEWPRERFRVHGIEYQPSDKTKSDIYRELVAPINGGRVELLDLPVLRAQLIALERRVARGGKDSIDHGPGGRDDVANAVAGALIRVMPAAAGQRSRPRVYFPGMKEETDTMPPSNVVFIDGRVQPAGVRINFPQRRKDQR